MKLMKTLQKPYSKLDKLNFICLYNHKLGYKIYETNEAIEAWGYTQEEIEVQQKQQRNQEIDTKIQELQIMCLPEILNGNTENISLYNEVIAGLEQAKL